MAALNTKVSFEIGGYVLVGWVIFIAPDFAADDQKCVEQASTEVWSQQ
jgi:hypothetical protein